jgi:glycosyl transferase, family 25
MFHQVFDQIYVINLVERSDRRAEMLEQLQKIGTDTASKIFQFFPAVRPSDAGEFPSVGARGCFMSHFKILEDARNQGHHRILILEDDCNFTRVLKEQWPGFSSLLAKTDWAILYGGEISRDARGKGQLASLDFHAVDAQSGIGGTHFVALQGAAINGAYQYLAAMLARPAGDPLGGPMHVDGAYSWFRRSHPGWVTMMCQPQIAYQRASRTDIHEGGIIEKMPGLGPVLNWLRSIKNRLSSDL